MAHIACTPEIHRGLSFKGLTQSILHPIAIWRQRQVLKSLDDHMLRDIGVSYRCAKQEFARPIWNVPSHWRK